MPKPQAVAQGVRKLWTSYNCASAVEDVCPFKKKKQKKTVGLGGDKVN